MDGSNTDTNKEDYIMNIINIGDTVRSYDFPGRKDCYIVGTVEAIVKIGESHRDNVFGDCDRYAINVSARRIDGVDVLVDSEMWAYPPVNGTPTWLGKNVTDGVVKVGTREASSFPAIMDLLSEMAIMAGSVALIIESTPSGGFRVAIHELNKGKIGIEMNDWNGDKFLSVCNEDLNSALLSLEQIVVDSEG